MLGGHHRYRARGERDPGDQRELGRAEAQQDLRQQPGEPWLHRYPAGEAARLRGHLAREDARDLLVGPVLQQPGEEQVPGLQQGEILLVLDLKAARLLPSGEVEDEEDLALLEARDLLFARLLQYRAYKEVAAIFAARMTAAARRVPRRVPLEPRFAGLLPEVLLGLGPAEFARLASIALAPKPPPKVDTGHIHAPVISIGEQAQKIATLLRELGRASFRRLTANAVGSYEVVASFLALLELYREDAVSFEQVAPLGELYVTWTGNASTDSFNELTESDDDE